MKADDFLAFAERICQAGDPAANRSATSRAYYAVFHTLIDMLAANNLRFVALNASHKKLEQLLTASNDPDIVDMGREVGDLCAERKKADYALGKADAESAPTAKTNVLVARSLMLRLRQALEPTKAQKPVAAMRTFARDVLRLPI